MASDEKTSVCMVLATIGLTALFGVSCMGSATTDNGGRADGIIVAKVNGEAIYKAALGRYAEGELRKFKKYGMMRPATPAVMRRMERRALDRMISEKLLEQQSRRVKVEGIENTIEQRLARIKRKYKGDEGVKRYFESQGVTESDVRENLRRKILTEAYLEAEGIQSPVIEEAEVKRYYEDTKKDYWRDEHIKASHILIKVEEGASEAEREVAREKAEGIRRKILGGEPFAAMARRFSEDGKAVDGGDLDYIKRGYMPAEFDRVAFGMRVGEVSEVVGTKFGFHIIKVADKRPAGVASYEEMRGFMEKYLQREASKERLKAHMEELRRNAEIEVFMEADEGSSDSARSSE